MSTAVTLTTAVQSFVASLTAEEQNLKSLYTALTIAEKQHTARGLEFGKACYELREKYSTGGRPKKSVSGETVSFESICAKLQIAKATAYRWIAKYEASIGRTPTVSEHKPDFWKELYHLLNALVPSISDGAEHKTVVMLEESLTRPATTQADRNYRHYVIDSLEKISVSFANYAQELRSAEVQ
jgi:hypothetical protein